MSYKKQVSKEHYSFEQYFYKGRWMSYWYQTNEITSRPDIKSVLDIGPGTNFLRNVVNIVRPDIEYKTLDIAADVKPDFVGGVTEIPLTENSYDLVSAFQVLEHLEFSDFEKALQEMKRVSKKYVFISLPHFGPQLTFSCKMPFLSKIQFAFKIPWPKELVFNGQHYWEIGRKGYSTKRIREVMKKYFILKNEYVPFENQYHRFFVLEKINEQYSK